MSGVHSKRTVASGGAGHPYERKGIIRGVMWARMGGVLKTEKKKPT